MKKKLIWILGGLFAVIILLVILKKTGVVGKETGEEVTSEKVQLRTITESVNASGKVYPEIEVKVSPDISGEVVNLFVEEGDKVTKRSGYCKRKPIRSTIRKCKSGIKWLENKL